MYGIGRDTVAANVLRRWINAGWVPLVLALLTVLFMLPFIDPSTPTAALDGSDLRNQVYPLTSLIFDRLRDGEEVPLWNPYQFAGQSIAGNPQSSLFYPPAWVMVPLGVPRGVGWLLVLHLWWAGWGFARFARRIGASPTGALVGGIVYEFSAFAAAHVGAGHFNFMLVYAWLPWMATAYWAARERPDWLRAGLPGAAAVGMSILAGYPPLVYLGMLWLGGLWLCGIAASHSQRLVAAWHTLRPLLIMVAGGVVLAAVLVLPVAELALRSTRTQDASLDFSNSFPMPAGQILTLAIPNLFGHPRLADHGYWGQPFYEELTAYMGIVPLVALFRARLTPIRILFVAMVVAGVIVSLGRDGGLFTLLYRLLPGYSLFRVPPRMLCLTVAGGAGLTALFITDLQTLDRAGRIELLGPAVRWVLPAGAVLVAVLAFGLLAYYTAHSADEVPPWRLLYSAHVTALAAVALAVAWAGLRLWTRAGSPGYERGLAALTALIVLVDVWHISSPMITASAVDVPEMWKVMARAVPARPDFRVMTVPAEVTWQAGATYTRHLNVNGYDPLVADQVAELLDASGNNPTTPVASLFGVRYVLTNKPYEWTGLSGRETLQEIAAEGEWHVYETANPLPRAFIAPTVQVIRDDEKARRVLASGEFDPLGSAVVAAPVSCVPEGPGEPATISEAQIVSYAPNVVEVRTRGDRAGVLVLTDTYDPFWTVTVDHKPADLLRVNTIFRGVCLAAGEHRVRFTYRPPLLVIGLAVSVIGWLSLAIFALFATGRNRIKSS